MSMNVISKALAFFCFCLLCGCYEQEKQIKKWAEENSEAYYINLIEKDAQSRSAKVGSELANSIQQTSRDLQKIVEEFKSFPELKLEANLSALEKKTRLYKYYRDLFLDWLGELIAIDSHLTRLETKVNEQLNLCQHFFKDHLLPPIDVAAMTTMLGEKSFEVYISFTANASSNDGGIHPNIDLNANKNIVEYLVTELINKPIGDLFASEEEKNALKRAQEILKERFPKEDKRREIALHRCSNTLSPLMAMAREQKDLIDTIKTKTHQTMNYLSSSATQSFVQLRKAVALHQKETTTKRHQEQVITEMFYRRGDVLAGYAKQIDRAIFDLIPKIYDGQLDKAFELLNFAKKVQKEYQSFLIDEDLDFFHSKFAVLSRQINKFEIKLNEFKVKAR